MDENELKITDLGRAGAAYAELLLKEKIAELDAALARAEAAERRVAELEAQLATMTILAIDSIGYYVLPGPGVSTSTAYPREGVK